MILVINDILSMSAYTIVAYKILTVLDDNHLLCLTTHCHSARHIANEINRSHLV